MLSNSVDLSAMSLVRKSLTVALPAAHPQLPVPINSDIMNVSSNLRAVPWQRRHPYSVFKTWSQQVITPTFPSPNQNCSMLFAGNSAERKNVAHFLNHTNANGTQIVFANLSNCTQVLREFFDNFYISKTEQSFPIAFLLVVHTNVQQTLRFLKAIYRSQNLYCIHPDLKTGKEFIEPFRLLSKCLTNVFIPSHVTNIDYKSPKTILEAQLSCLRDLEAHRYRKWKFVINLCSRELPVKTNRFIVKYLSKMNGVSILKPQLLDEYTLQTRFNRMTRQVAKEAGCDKANITCIEESETFLRKHGIKLYKSMAYNALSYEFVHHLLHNDTLRELTQWMIQNCKTPEEHLYATAYMIPGIPGGFSFNKSKNFPLVSKSYWKHEKTSHYYVEGESPCSGRSVHQVCILTSADLPLINRAVKDWSIWFLNKFFMEEDHVVMDCVEELLINHNKQEFYNDYRLLPS